MIDFLGWDQHSPSSSLICIFTKPTSVPTSVATKTVKKYNSHDSHYFSLRNGSQKLVWQDIIYFSPTSYSGSEKQNHKMDYMLFDNVIKIIFRQVNNENC